MWPSSGNARCTLLPTKTSLFWIQLWGSEYLVSRFLHVAFISLVYCFSHLIFVAVILSSVNLLFMAFDQRASTSLMEWFLSWIILLHLSTQIRCATSEIRIWRSWVAPFWFVVVCLCSGGHLGCVWADRFSHPRMIPRDISGHLYCSWSHASLVHLHIAAVVVCVQPIGICSMDSVISQVLQSPLLSKPCMWYHTSPTIGVLCSALKRNCCTLVWMVCFLRLFQIVLSVSKDPW